MPRLCCVVNPRVKCVDCSEYLCFECLQERGIGKEICPASEKARKQYPESGWRMRRQGHTVVDAR